jgi:hypothetical protein
MEAFRQDYDWVITVLGSKTDEILDQNKDKDMQIKIVKLYLMYSYCAKVPPVDPKTVALATISELKRAELYSSVSSLENFTELLQEYLGEFVNVVDEIMQM